jgi:putative membrane protein
MTRLRACLFAGGILLFIGVLVSQGVGAVLAMLLSAGWGLGLVAMFHLLPLVLDAAAIRVLFDTAAPPAPMRDATLARWVGESVNSLLPAGQLGGPVLMVRYLAGCGMQMPPAAAAITVSLTLQAFSQILFALLGVVLLGAVASHVSPDAQRLAALVACVVLAAQVGGFYFLQRRGFFASLLRAVTRFSSKRDWSQVQGQAEAIDAAVQTAYGRNKALTASFLLSLLAWLVGTGEVYLIARLLGFPVGWIDALLLESLGQAIRGAAFAIPGALGVQEGGYLLLAPVVGLPPEACLALSLAKRARELLLGLPGLVYLHYSERDSRASAKKIMLATNRNKP